MRIGSNVGIVALMCAAVTSLGWAQTSSPARVTVVIYTKDKAPHTPKLEDLPLRESVSQHGITWAFDKPAPVGQFVTGDFYVVGPVMVKAIAPPPRYGKDVTNDELDSYEQRKIKTNAFRREQVVRNGSVLNPPPAQEVGYDSGVRNYFRPSVTAKLPIAMKPGDSLVSTISLKLGEAYSFPYHSGGRRATGDVSPVKVAAILSCVTASQPPDAFRPAYCDRKQTIYLSRNLKARSPGRLAASPKHPQTGYVGRCVPAAVGQHGIFWVRPADGEHASLRSVGWPGGFDGWPDAHVGLPSTGERAAPHRPGPGGHRLLGSSEEWAPRLAGLGRARQRKEVPHRFRRPVPRRRGDGQPHEGVSQGQLR